METETKTQKPKSEKPKKPPMLRSQEMFDWLTETHPTAIQETGLEWRRRLVSEVVAKPGVWGEELTSRLSNDLADAINYFADNEVSGMDEYGHIAYLMVFDGLYHVDWKELAEAILEKDGFYSGTEPQEALSTAEIEAYLARTPVAAEA